MELKGELETLVAHDVENGEYWSICVKELDTGDYLSINSRPCEAASLIKLFAAGTALEEARGSELLNRLLDDMIIISDNQAYNDLVTYIGEGDPYEGFEKINVFTEEYGYYDTYAESFYAPGDFLVEGPIGINYTSVQDCADFLEDVYRGKFAFSRKLLTRLKKQEFTWKLPAGLPEGVMTANKTGEIDNAEHDACIVYTDTGDYIITVMTYDLWSTEEAQYQIQEISALVYEYLTGEMYQSEKNMRKIIDN